MSKHASGGDERTARILALLDGAYGTDLRCFLDYEPQQPWQLLVSVILSAQCTDARVNQVTPALFAAWPSVEAMAEAPLEELEKAIYATGFYHSKAKNIRECCRRLRDEFGGQVPSDIESLTSLPGVGRKTANVIRGNVYGEPSVVVDTHVKRIAARLGFTRETDPVKVEKDLMEALPEDHWILCNLQLITLGRSLCQSQRPRCGECFLREECPSAGSFDKKKKTQTKAEE